MLDVFIRASSPQLNAITLEGILDGKPLQFGTDLETFGGHPDPGEYIHITEVIPNAAMRPGIDRYGVAVNNILLVSQYKFNSPYGPDQDLSTIPWKASQQDVGRFIQILNAGRQALLKIDAVLGEEFTSLDGTGSWKVVRVRLDPALINQENGSAYVLGTNLSFDTDIRIVEQTSVKYRVRDRDGSRNMDAILPRIPVGLDFDLKGSKIGDSVVIETGDDAGIYSIRRILSSMGDNDSLILDRKLANSTVPDGTGNSSGLRYRVADELNVDLVTPKVIRIPLGDIFLGLDLNSVAGNKVVTSGGDTNFLLAGAQAGDTLEILEGDNRGKYSVVSVAGLSLELDSPVQNTAFSQEFSVYKAYKGIDRPLVRVKEIELLDSNSKTTGIKIPYGRPIDVRAIGLFSNRAEGVKTESFTGAVTALGYLLTDDEVDFEAEKITESFRVNIINTRNAGTYTIVEVGVGGDPHTIRVAPEAEGGSEFVEIATGVHYSVGLPSAGFVRFSFLQPTTMEIQTGLDGARLSFNESGSPRSFRFSEVEGYSLLPAPGSTDSRLRDLRVARLYGGPTDFDSIVELTDLGHPDAFGMEFMEGDILEVNEQLPFRTTKATAATCAWPSGTGATGTVTCTNTGGIYPNRWVRKNSSSPFFRVLNVTANTSFLVDNPNGLTFPGGSAISAICSTFEELGVFGKPAGLRTIAGSNRVWIPANSLMDFQAMNGVYPLAGQLLRIDSGPDAGEYVIEEVVDTKTLRLNTVMTSSTQTLTDNMRDLTPREVKPNTQLISSGSGSSTDLQDLTDAGGLGSTVGQYITIFESTRGDIDGAYKIKGLVSTGRVTLDVPLTKIPRPDTVGDAGYPDLDPRGVGPFSWMRSDSSTNIEQPFHVYRSVAIQAQVVQVATKRADSVVGPKRGYTGIGTGGYNVRMTAANGTFAGVQAGDRLEVLSGPNSGVYPVSLVDTVLYSYVDIVYNPTNYFQVLASDIPFRVWGGLHGARTMMTVSSYESHNGRIYPGQLMLYRVVRPKIYHISSTDMAKNFDGIFYYADIQVESDGSGDEYNLTENSRLEVTESGLAAGKVKADGYIHDVDNANLTFSTFEQVSLIFSRRFLPVGNTDSPENRSEISGRNLQVSYEQSTTAKLVHDLLRSDTERPINANPLGRHFLPSYLFVNLVYRGGVSADIVGNDISDFVNSLGAEAQLEVSELEAYITRRGATSVDHPIEIATVTHDLDRNLVVDRSDNKLGGRNEVPYNGTGRTSAFFAILGEGLKVDRQS
jgi:hypothetical protein